MLERSLVLRPAVREGGALLIFLAALPFPALLGLRYPLLPAGLTG